MWKVQYHRCTTVALGVKNCMAGARRLWEETRAYVVHERCRGMASSEASMERTSVAAGGVNVKLQNKTWLCRTRWTTCRARKRSYSYSLRGCSMRGGQGRARRMMMIRRHLRSARVESELECCAGGSHRKTQEMEGCTRTITIVRNVSALEGWIAVIVLQSASLNEI